MELELGTVIVGGDNPILEWRDVINTHDLAHEWVIVIAAPAR